MNLRAHRLQVSLHAAERYRERIDPRVNRPTATAILARVLESGFVCVGHRGGAALFRDPRRPMKLEVFVVGRMVVTVMDPACQTAEHDREMVIVRATSERAHAESCGEAAVVCAAEPQGEAACARSGAEGARRKHVD